MCIDNKELYVIATFANEADIVILDFITLQTVYVLKGHKARIISINFDSSFNKLLSLSKDRTARIWDFDRIMNLEVNRQKIKVEKGPVLALAFDKTHSKYVTSHQNGEINVWNAQDNSFI